MKKKDGKKEEKKNEKARTSSEDVKKEDKNGKGKKEEKKEEKDNKMRTSVSRGSTMSMTGVFDRDIVQVHTSPLTFKNLVCAFFVL